MASINLAEVRIVGGEVKNKLPQNGKFAIQLWSANLSANTAFNLQYSADRTNWANAQSNGADVSGTLAANVPYLQPFECGVSLYWRIVFEANASTGTVNYITVA